MKTRAKLRANGTPDWEVQLIAKDLKSNNPIAKGIAKATIKNARKAAIRALRDVE